MSGKSFLRVFGSILHAVESAAVIAAPIIKTVDPEIGALMAGATAAAVQVEAAYTTPGSGADKQQAVHDSTAAAFNVANQIIVSQGKAPMPAATVDAAVAGAVTVVSQMNAIANAVDAAKPATPAA